MMRALTLVPFSVPVKKFRSKLKRFEANKKLAAAFYWFSRVNLYFNESMDSLSCAAIA